MTKETTSSEEMTFEQACRCPDVDVWVVCWDGVARPVADLQCFNTSEDDDDDDLCYVTDPWLVEKLGFDPRELMTDQELDDEWTEICRRARAAQALYEPKPAKATGGDAVRWL